VKTVLRAEIGQAAWDGFCDCDPRAWFWHRWGWLDYGMALGGQRMDVSFAVLNDNRIIALFPQIVEGERLTFEGEPGAWPLAPLRSLDGLPPFRPGSFRSCPLAENARLSRWGSVHVGWQSRVMNLRLSEAELHAGVRKSYKALINRGLQRYEIVIGTSETLALGYQAVHGASVGQIAPRPERTYELQWEWARDGFAFYVGARAQGASRQAVAPWVAFAYIFTYKGGAYYGSGPSVEPDVMHAVLWSAILEAKRLGFKRFEIGWLGHARDDKERAVEFFKAGFPGEDIPVYVMEVENAHRVSS